MLVDNAVEPGIVGMGHHMPQIQVRADALREAKRARAGGGGFRQRQTGCARLKELSCSQPALLAQAHSSAQGERLRICEAGCGQ